MQGMHSFSTIIGHTEIGCVVSEGNVKGHFWCTVFLSQFCNTHDTGMINTASGDTFPGIIALPVVHDYF